MARFFDGLCPADEGAHFRAEAGGHHDRGRRCQTHGTRARDDQHAYGGADGGSCLNGREKMAEERHHGDGEDEGDKSRSDAISESGELRFAGLRLIDQANDVRQRGIAADLSSLDSKEPAEVDGARSDGLADHRFDWHAFAGEHGGVDRGLTIDDCSIDRKRFSWPDEDEVMDEQRIDRDGFEFLFHYARGGGWGEAKEFADGLACPAARATFEPFAERHQREHHDRIMSVAVRVWIDECDGETVKESGSGPQGNQGVHIRRSLDQAVPGAEVVWPTDDPLQEDGSQERDDERGLMGDQPGDREKDESDQRRQGQMPMKEGFFLSRLGLDLRKSFGRTGGC